MGEEAIVAVGKDDPMDFLSPRRSARTKKEDRKPQLREEDIVEVSRTDPLADFEALEMLQSKYSSPAFEEKRDRVRKRSPTPQGSDEHITQTDAQPIEVSLEDIHFDEQVGPITCLT